MRLIVDSREQRPYSDLFREIHKIECEVKGLKVGDYSIEGYEDKFAIERKSLNDFVGSITQGRQRFLREIERATQYEYFAIVIECTLQDILSGNYRSKTHPASVIGTIASWSIKYKIPIFFAGNRSDSAILVMKLAKKYLDNLEKQE